MEEGFSVHVQWFSNVFIALPFVLATFDIAEETAAGAKGWVNTL